MPSSSGDSGDSRCSSRSSSSSRSMSSSSSSSSGISNGSCGRRRSDADIERMDMVLEGLAKKSMAAQGVGVAGRDTAVYGADGAVHGADPAVHGADAAVHGADPAVRGVDAAVHGVDAAVHSVDLAVHGVDAADVLGAGIAAIQMYWGEQQYTACRGGKSRLRVCNFRLYGEAGRLSGAVWGWGNSRVVAECPAVDKSPAGGGEPGWRETAQLAEKSPDGRKEPGWRESSRQQGNILAVRRCRVVEEEAGILTSGRTSWARPTPILGASHTNLGRKTVGQFPERLQQQTADKQGRGMQQQAGISTRRAAPTTAPCFSQ
eukprot:63577-Chlamydomonas_euryale.AAC.3